MTSTRFFSVILASIFISISPAFIKAENPPATPPTDDSKPPETIKAEPAVVEKKPHTSTSAVALDQKGKIEKVDADANSVVVAGKTFVLSQRSRVEIDGSIMTIKDLKVGDLVAVVYFAKSDGTNTATRIIKGNAPRKSKKSSSSATPTESKTESK